MGEYDFFKLSYLAFKYQGKQKVLEGWDAISFDLIPAF
jgi:hypothetical protein